MKQLLLAFCLLFAFGLNAQRQLMKFTQASNSSTIVLNADDIAYIFPVSSTVSTLVMGPAVHTVNVSEAVDTICQRSYGQFLSATEIQTRLAGSPTRTVGISRSHIGEIVAGTGSQTTVKLKNPVMSVTLSGTIATLYPTFTGDPYIVKTDTANYAARLGVNVINHSGTVATDSVFLPASPVRGDYVKLVYKTAVTALVVNGSGKTITGTAATSASAGTVLEYTYYESPLDVWIRTQ